MSEFSDIIHGEIFKLLETLNFDEEMNKVTKILKLEQQHTQEQEPTTDEPHIDQKIDVYRLTSNIIISLHEDNEPKQKNILLIEGNKRKNNKIKNKKKPSKHVLNYESKNERFLELDDVFNLLGVDRDNDDYDDIMRCCWFHTENNKKFHKL